MHAAERSQKGAQPCACPFTGVAVDFPHAIAIVVTRPLVPRVIDRGMREIQPMVTALLVRIDDRGITRDGFVQNRMPWLLALSLWPTKEQRSSPLSRLMT